MTWLLGVSLGLNLILLIAWLKTLEESREWKACARIGFDTVANPDQTPELVRYVLRERKRAAASRLN